MNKYYKLISFLIMLLGITTWGSNNTITPVVIPTKKIAIVTGSASGIGQAISLKLIAQGYIVYGIDIQTEANSYLNNMGSKALTVDITNDSMVNVAVQSIINEQKRIDVLVNNAGYGSFSSIENISMDELKKQFDVNVFGYARMIKAVLPTMKKQKYGKIIQISSISGIISMPMTGWYSASKHAVEAMSDALRMEVNDFNIQVVKIQPGIIQTPFYGLALAKLDSNNTKIDYPTLYQKFISFMAKAIAEGENAGSIADIVIEAILTDTPNTFYRFPDEVKFKMAQRFFSENKIDEKLLDMMDVKIKQKKVKPTYKKHRVW